MGLFRTLEISIDIKAPASKFQDMIHGRPHHISNISSDKVKSCELHEGDWGKVGSIQYWNYVHDGKASVVKDVLESVDEENNSFTYKVIEGDLLKHYKNFRIISKCIPKDKGSVMHFTFEYEKLHEEIPDSHSLLQLCADVAKDIDDHLMGNNEVAAQA